MPSYYAICQGALLAVQGHKGHRPLHGNCPGPIMRTVTVWIAIEHMIDIKYDWSECLFNKMSCWAVGSVNAEMCQWALIGDGKVGLGMNVIVPDNIMQTFMSTIYSMGQKNVSDLPCWLLHGLWCMYWTSRCSSCSGYAPEPKRPVSLHVECGLGVCFLLPECPQKVLHTQVALCTVDSDI
jgi:hypothetical protein